MVYEKYLQNYCSALVLEDFFCSFGISGISWEIYEGFFCNSKDFKLFIGCYWDLWDLRIQNGLMMDMFSLIIFKDSAAQSKKVIQAKLIGANHRTVEFVAWSKTDLLSSRIFSFFLRTMKLIQKVSKKLHLLQCKYSKKVWKESWHFTIPFKICWSTKILTKSSSVGETFQGRGNSAIKALLFNNVKTPSA